MDGAERSCRRAQAAATPALRVDRRTAVADRRGRSSRTAVPGVWREHRDLAWPLLLRYWGVPNLQVINRDVHAEKCAAEARQRRAAKRQGTERLQKASPAVARMLR